MKDVINNIADGLTWQAKYNPNAPKRGDKAPDFELRDIRGENPIRLSQLGKQKPVALVFGSFT